ncbi:Protein of unknown function [Bryocella elongata]|uniref:Carotenoid biosynthesis protein n=2 Tax=Bryocella elongata TaxID=863522 RepID=A0A1H5X072_9BACT|nr:Protein of unknown function [Bryocella elongata]
MLPFPGIPYGPAPAWVFPAFELSSYAMLALCLAHAIRRGRIGSLSYIFGGLGFGLLLEYLEVRSHSYTYGHFGIMLGHAPFNIPLCIGCDWAVIMYVSRIFSDALRLPWQAAAALDTLLALNVDLSLDVVAYRLHMWHWNWPPQYNALTTQWFGIPYGNFVGWITVVFGYSFFSRWFERLIVRHDHTQHHRIAAWQFPLVAALSLIASQLVLTFNEVLLYPFVARHLSITSPRRFSLFAALLLITAVTGWARRPRPRRTIPSLATFAPVYFHLFFLMLFFAFGFYRESRWMTAVSCSNGALGILLHLLPFTKSSAKAREAIQGSSTEPASA